jgi:hypothetical protein
MVSALMLAGIRADEARRLPMDNAWRMLQALAHTNATVQMYLEETGFMEKRKAQRGPQLSEEEALNPSDVEATYPVENDVHLAQMMAETRRAA